MTQKGILVFFLRAHSLVGICLKSWQPVTKAEADLEGKREKWGQKASCTNAAAQLEHLAST